MQPATPRLIPAFSLVAELARPMAAGPGLGGERLHIPITGGTVTGRIEGAILPVGSDWALRRSDGATEVSAAYSLRLTDGTLVWVRNHGLRTSSPAVLARLMAGETVDPADYRFRCAPRFDVPDGAHQWLRETLFVGSLLPQGARITIAVWELA